MIIQHTTNPIESSTLPVTQFRINVSAHAFDVLINKQYKDKPASIIREVLSNALDSHVERSQIRPVEVLLPTALNPTLTVKDYGTGISPDDIANVYTVLFESTRNASNKFRGGFGLGCKVPFAYADQFTVESRWNHTCYTYVMYKDGANIPACALLSAEPTDEPKGVTIRIAVDPQDIAAFTHAAEKILPWFGDQVTTNIPLPPRNTLWKNDRAELAHHKNPPSPFAARIGNVIYPIDGYTARTILSTISLKHGNRIIYHGHLLPDAVIILDFPIGLLQVTPNREDLIQDDNTYAVIANAIREFIADITTWLRDQDIPDPLQATKELFPITRILRELSIPVNPVCKQRHVVNPVVEFTPPDTWKTYYVNPQSSRRRSFSTKLVLNRTALNTLALNTLALQIDHTICVLHAPANARYLHTRVALTPITDSYSGRPTIRYLLVCTDDTPQQVADALTPYSIKPVRVDPLPDYTPPKKVIAPKKAADKSTLWLHDGDQCRTPPDELFYVLPIDRPLVQIKKAVLLDYPTLPVHHVAKFLLQLRAALPGHVKVPETVYLYAPSQANAVRKNPNARSFAHLVSSLIPHLDHTKIWASTTNGNAIAQLQHNNYAHARFTFLTNLRGIPARAVLPTKLARLVELNPTTTCADYQVLIQTLGLTNPGNHPNPTQEIISLLDHYKTFVTNRLDPSEPDILLLINLYDTATTATNP